MVPCKSSSQHHNLSYESMSPFSKEPPRAFRLYPLPRSSHELPPGGEQPKLRMTDLENGLTELGAFPAEPWLSIQPSVWSLGSRYSRKCQRLDSCAIPTPCQGHIGPAGAPSRKLGFLGAITSFTPRGACAAVNLPYLICLICILSCYEVSHVSYRSCAYLKTDTALNQLVFEVAYSPKIPSNLAKTPHK
jgi:hypothetical protein